MLARIRNLPPPLLPIELNKDLKVTASPALQKELDTANGSPVCLSRAAQVQTPPVADEDKDFSLLVVYPCGNESGGKLREGRGVVLHSATWLDVIMDPVSGTFVNVQKLALTKGSGDQPHFGVGSADAKGVWALDTLCNGAEGSVCNLDFFDQTLSISSK